MKQNFKQGKSKRLRYGGVTAVLTALIIASVILLNVILSALSDRYFRSADLTPSLHFTLSENCIDLIRNGDPTFGSESPVAVLDRIRAEKRAADPTFSDEDLMINIIFCDDEKAWDDAASETKLCIYETAKQLQQEFPDYIRYQCVDILWNPQAVSQYEGINSTSQVVIEFGSEYRVRDIEDFFEYEDDTMTTLWAYNGEKAFASAILSVTRAESPIACIVTNHGEVAPIDLAKTLDLAGFEVQSLNLAALPPEDYEGDAEDYNPIPNTCRLIVVYNPTSDFMEAGDLSFESDDENAAYVDELERLDDFLAGEVTGTRGSMMVFLSSEQRLDNFEDYLTEWGIVFNRAEDGSPYRVIDETQSLDYNVGSTIRAEYVTQGGGGDITEALWKDISNPRPVIFKDAMSISYDTGKFTMKHYTDSEDSSISYDYAEGGANGSYRAIYDVFVSSENAYATVNGEQIAKATSANPFKLMTLSVETEKTQTDNYGSYVVNGSYVLACGSPDFASQSLLQSTAYGNGAFLEYALRIIGQEIVPVNLTFKILNDSSMDTITAQAATTFTVVLTIVPIVICVGVGAFVLIRRKNR